MDLREIADRLDSEEKLKLMYHSPVKAGSHLSGVVRTDRLLDVEEDRGILFVDRDGQPAWVKIEEAIEIISDYESGG